MDKLVEDVEVVGNIVVAVVAVAASVVEDTQGSVLLAVAVVVELLERERKLRSMLHIELHKLLLPDLSLQVEGMV